MGKKAWMVRPPYFEGESRAIDFLEGQFISVAFPLVGNLTGATKEEIWLRFADADARFRELSKVEQGANVAPLDYLVNHMDCGDYVMIPAGEQIFFAVITGDYVYREHYIDVRYVHQRPIMGIGTSYPRTELPKVLRSAMKTRRIISNITKYIEEIEALLNGEAPCEDQPEGVTVSYPLRPDFPVEFSIPADMTQTEAMRLSNFLLTLYFEQTE